MLAKKSLGMLALVSSQIAQALPAVEQAASSSGTFDFTKNIPPIFKDISSPAVTVDAQNGGAFTISATGDSPHLVTTQAYTSGIFTCVMQAMNVGGVVSAFVLLSEAGDEVDFEFLGHETTQVRTNFFSKHVRTFGADEGSIPVSDPTTTFHSYTIDWNAERIILSVDGNMATARTIRKQDVGSRYPDTPMYLRLNAWIGCPNQDCFDNEQSTQCGSDVGVNHWTCVWVGKPYLQEKGSMYVKSIAITAT